MMAAKPRSPFAVLLRQHMDNCGYSIREMAARCGRSSSRIEAWRAEQIPGEDAIRRLCRELSLGPTQAAEFRRVADECRAKRYPNPGYFRGTP